MHIFYLKTFISSKFKINFMGYNSLVFFLNNISFKRYIIHWSIRTANNGQPLKTCRKRFSHKKKKENQKWGLTPTHSAQHTHALEHPRTHTRLQQKQRIGGPKGKRWLIVLSESPGSSGKKNPKNQNNPPTPSPLSKETTSRKFSSALETWSFELFLQSSSLHLRKMQPKVTCANIRSQEYLLPFLK